MRAPHVVNAIAADPPVSWQHINLHGEYDSWPRLKGWSKG